MLQASQPVQGPKCLLMHHPLPRMLLWFVGFGLRAR